MALKLLSQTHLLRPIQFSAFTSPILHRKLLLKPFSTCVTRYPFHYELIDYRPTKSSLRRPISPLPKSPPGSPEERSKRKYLHKRRRKMYGMDSEEEAAKGDGGGFIELEPVVMEFKSLHQREEELYFYDAFCYPWEKNKHYRMMYQLEKKLFPDHCFDKAFLCALGAYHRR